MFYLVNPFWSDHKFSFLTRHHIPHIIIHDGRILLHHGIPLDLLICCLLISRRLKINDLTHKSHVAGKFLRWPNLPKGSLRSLNMLLGILQGLLSSSGPPPPCSGRSIMHRSILLLILLRNPNTCTCTCSCTCTYPYTYTIWTYTTYTYTCILILWSYQLLIPCNCWNYIMRLPKGFFFLKLNIPPSNCLLSVGMYTL